MKRIAKAINEGLDHLILFDDDSKFKKSTKVKVSIKDFHVGDYVYYSHTNGYTSVKIGEPVAVCIDDTEGDELYIVINKIKGKHVLAKQDTMLYKDCWPEFENGYDGTQYILENYRNEINGTIWAKLRQDEYIPTLEELKRIYDKHMNDVKISDIIVRLKQLKDNIGPYCTVSLTPTETLGNEHPYIDAINPTYYYGPIVLTFKDTKFNALTLLHID